ncbi:MAG: sigma-70 family RNA polymerase sigma factor [Oscillospiraceae bacterium]|nr:sigma-70 family RNA polymerase sigma factor [Oscillospiraceae bacterium]
MDLDAIYRAEGRTVYRYLLALCGQEHLAEELTQETFYQAVKGIDRYDPNRCQISTWLCAIAKRQYLRYLRKHPPEQELTEDVPDRERQADLLQHVAYLELLQHIHAMEDPAREVLYLRLFGDLSFREIGQLLGKTENWARVTFYRGKERLKKELSDP